jgi:hypothetical protein
MVTILWALEGDAFWGASLYKALAKCSSNGSLNIG